MTLVMLDAQAEVVLDPAADASRFLARMVAELTTHGGAIK